MGFGDVDDDYDPARPNDYMLYCRERINKKKQEERDRELKIIMEEQEREVGVLVLEGGGGGLRARAVGVGSWSRIRTARPVTAVVRAPTWAKGLLGGCSWLLTCVGPLPLRVFS